MRLSELIHFDNLKEESCGSKLQVNLGQYKILWLNQYINNFYYLISILIMKRNIESSKLPSFRSPIEKRVSANDVIMYQSKP